MELRDGLTINDLAQCDVVAYILLSDNVQPIANCRTFTLDGVPHIDFIPKFDRRYSAPIPDDAIVAKSVDGEIGIFIQSASPAGLLAMKLAVLNKLTAHEQN